MRYCGGERDLWSVVQVPSVEEEDARRRHREREASDDYEHLVAWMDPVTAAYFGAATEIIGVVVPAPRELSIWFIVAP